MKIIKLMNTEKQSMRNQSKTLQKVLQPSKTVDASLNEKIFSIRTINHLEVEPLNLNLLSFHKGLPNLISCGKKRPRDATGTKEKKLFENLSPAPAMLVKLMRKTAEF